MPVQYGSLPFEEQIAYFREKTNVPTERWADLWKNAHDRGFMVAGAMQEDLLADFCKAVDGAIADGKSLNWFKREFNRIVEKHGWEHTGAASWRSQVIYDTNMRQSYAAGREQQIEQVKALRPYGLYRHSGSEHPRLDHLSWNNLVIPLDDPWWETHTPINGFGCKCRKFTLSERDLERLDLKVSDAPKVEYYEWTDKATGEVHQIPKGIDPGFDYTPKSSAALTEKTQTILDRKLPLAERLPERLVESAYSTVKGANATDLSRVLRDLNSPEVELFAAAIKKHDLKTLFLEEKYLVDEDAASDVVLDVMEYLDYDLMAPVHPFVRADADLVDGYFHPSWGHAVIKVDKGVRFSKVDAEALSYAVSDIIKLGAGDELADTFSSAIYQRYSYSEAVASSWVHEMGHAIYHSLGYPALPSGYAESALTFYAQLEQEWFSEHLVAWVLAPDALKAHRPDIYQFITDTLKEGK